VNSRSPARFPQTFPNVAGVEIAAHCRPAQAVGGDYYDLIDIRDGSLAEAGHAPSENISSASGSTARGCDPLGVAIGDISGKGMSAALLMASLHASLRGQVLSRAGDLGTKMANVNRLLYEASGSNRYATFFYAELDCDSRTLHYVNGGTILLRCCAKRMAHGGCFAWEMAALSLGCLPARPTSSRCFPCSPAIFYLPLLTASAKL